MGNGADEEAMVREVSLAQNLGMREGATMTREEARKQWEESANMVSFPNDISDRNRDRVRNTMLPYMKEGK